MTYCMYLHNDHIQAQNKHTANGVLFEATHLQWRCCVREISFLITTHQLTNELGERMGRHDNRKKRVQLLLKPVYVIQH